MKKLYLGMVILICSFSGATFAAQLGVYSKVTTILIDDVKYGGCMAALETPPTSVGLNCADPWVTFSCTGDFGTKSQGQTKLAAAQLALVTQTTLYVLVDDTRKHNGYCFASRADNYR